MKTRAAVAFEAKKPLEMIDLEKVEPSRSTTSVKHTKDRPMTVDIRGYLLRPHGTGALKS
jgi:hypothetical protein